MLNTLSLALQFFFFCRGFLSGKRQLFKISVLTIFTIHIIVLYFLTAWLAG